MLGELMSKLLRNPPIENPLNVSAIIVRMICCGLWRILSFLAFVGARVQNSNWNCMANSSKACSFFYSNEV